MKENKFLQSTILFLVSFLLPLYIIQVDIFFLSFTLYDLFLYLCALLVVVFFRQHLLDLLQRKLSVVAPTFLIFGLFALGSLIGVAVSSDLITSLGIFRSYVVSLALFLIVTFSLCRNASHLRSIQVGYIVSAGILSLFALYQYIDLLLSGQSLVRVASIFESPNYLALYVAPAILIAIQSNEVFYKMRYSRIVYIVVSSVSLLLSASRGALIAVVIASTVLLLGNVIVRMNARKIVAFGLVMIFLVTGLYGVGRIFWPERVLQSDSIRIAILDQSISMAVDSPIVGYGLGQYQAVFAERTQKMINFPEYITPHARTPHNVWLNMWLQTGILGLLSIVLLYVLLLVAVLRDEQRTRIVYMSIFFFYLVYGFFESVNWKNDLMIVFWLLMSWPVYHTLITLHQTQKKN